MDFMIFSTILCLTCFCYTGYVHWKQACTPMADPIIPIPADPVLDEDYISIKKDI